MAAGSIEEGETSPAPPPVNPQGGYQQTAEAPRIRAHRCNLGASKIAADRSSRPPYTLTYGQRSGAGSLWCMERVLHGVVEPIGVPVVGRPPHAQHRCELLLHFRRRAERPGPVPGRVGRGSRRARVLHVPGVDPCGPLVPPAQPGKPVRLRGSRGYRQSWITAPPVTMSAPPRTRPGVACSPNATRPTSWLTTKKSTM